MHKYVILSMYLPKIHTHGITILSARMEKARHYSLQDGPEEEKPLKISSQKRLLYIAEPFCKSSLINEPSITALLPGPQDEKKAEINIISYSQQVT